MERCVVGTFLVMIGVNTVRAQPETRPAPATVRVIELGTEAPTRRRETRVWDAISVLEGEFYVQDDPTRPNPCTGQHNDRLRTEAVNSGDLQRGTRISRFDFGYATDAPGGSTTCPGVGCFTAHLTFYNQWSEGHDGFDPTDTPPTIAAGYIIGPLPADPSASWIVSVHLDGAMQFVLDGSDEDGDGLADWGWGIRLAQDPLAPRVLGPLIADAGPEGSDAPGAEDSFSRYLDRPLNVPCGYLSFGVGLWSDFALALYSEGGPCDDCDADTVCDFDERDCDSSGTPDECEPDFCAADLAPPIGVLNVFDFLAFQTAFGGGEPCADISPPLGVLNVFDFLGFQSSFGSGC